MLHRRRPFHATMALAILAAATGGPPPHYSFTGAAADDRLGTAVSAAGDVDADGFGDVIAGAPGDDTNGADSGSARVWSGRNGAVLRTFFGGSADDRLGWSVGGAGDVDGDGHADLIVGAPGDNDMGADSGSARVYSGRTGAVLHFFRGGAAGDLFGWSVAGAGDVNGDGYADLIAGAPGDDDGGADAGTARVLSGRNAAVLHTFTGNSSGDRLGHAVAGAGDFDDDGFADLVVGAPYDNAGASDAGRAYVFSGANGAALAILAGLAADDHFGWAVSGAGNVDADRFADVAIGAPGSDAGGVDSGSVRVARGPAGAFSLQFFGDRAGAALGTSVGAGEFDGDGRSDVIAGAPDADAGAPDGGAVRVWSGANGARLYSIDGAGAGDQLGASVGGGGDVDGDGFADFVAGAPFDDTGGANAGGVRVWALAPYAAHAETRTLNPSVSRGGFGTFCEAVGDVDHDGRDDYMVGAPWDVGTLGAARVYSGADHSVLHTFLGSAPNIYFGIKVAASGDIDRDGYADVIVGSVHDNTIASQCGAAHIYSGRTGALLRSFFGPQTRTHMGTAVGTIGDVDGDAVDDVFIGLGTLNTENGEIWVMSGRTGARIYRVPGPNDSWFGWSGSPVGDLSGDGIIDFVVGAPEPVSGGPGFARVLSGVDGATIYQFNGTAPGDLFGFHSDAAGDVNGDGKTDILVSGYTADPFKRSAAGMARVFSGATGALLREVFGEVAGDMFGDGLAGAGDANGDGFDDFLVGAPAADPGGRTDAGSAYLFSGRNGALLRRIDGKVAMDALGKSVTGIGDVNGDSYAEFVVGAPLADDPSLDAGVVLVFDSEPRADPGWFGTYGAGCPGALGKLPGIGAIGRPTVGTTFRTTLAAAKPMAPIALAFDAVRQSIPLAVLGAPGCTLLALPLLSLPGAANASGRASIGVPVPLIPALVGGSVYLQWSIADCCATPLGLAFSNGGAAKLGRP